MELAVHTPSASTVSFMTISTRSTWCRFQRPSKALRFWSRKGRIWATAWQGRTLVVLQALLGHRSPDSKEGLQILLFPAQRRRSEAIAPGQPG